MKYVVLAADNHPDFQFILPITAVLWAERTIYKPLVLSTYTGGELKSLAKQGIISLKTIGTEITANRLSIKLVRWYSWQWANPDDELFLMDADLWPIDGEFHNPKTDKDVVLFYADAYKGRMYSTAAVRARATALKEITKGESVTSRMREIAEYPEQWEGHHSDDCSQSELLLKWPGYPSHCHMINRGPSPPKTRIDRADWPTKFKLDGMIDAHLPRDIADVRVWKLIEPLFNLLAPYRIEWVKKYTREFWKQNA